MSAPVRVHEVPDPEQDLGPLRQRGRAPGRERGLGRGDRRVDLLHRGEVDLAGELRPWPGRRPGRAGRTCRPRAGRRSSG